MTVRVALMVVLLTLPAIGAEVAVDCTKQLPKLKPINGTNCGPVEQQGLIDLTAYYKAMRFPLARLHDSHWPNPDVVDIHAVFPDHTADPTKPASYDFERTDEYVKGVIDAGAEVVYRLGESIEHQKAKRHARPPKDFEKWAAVCVGIVRHYTE